MTVDLLREPRHNADPHPQYTKANTPQEGRGEGSTGPARGNDEHRADNERKGPPLYPQAGEGDGEGESAENALEEQEREITEYLAGLDEHGGLCAGSPNAAFFGGVLIPIGIVPPLFDALETLSEEWPIFKEEEKRRWALWDLLVAEPDPRYSASSPRHRPLHEVACAVVKRRPELIRQHRVGVVDFVERLEREIPDAFSFLPHLAGDRCTMVSMEWPDYVLEAAEQDRTAPFRDHFVDYMTGRPVSRSREREQGALVRTLNEVMADTPDHHPRAIRDLQVALNGADRRLFSRPVNIGAEVARNEVAKRLRAGDHGEEAARYCHRLLDAIDPGMGGDPRPLYKGVRDSVRLFPTGLSLLNAPGWMRAIILPESLELDLRSAHAAFIASLWGLPRLRQALSGGSLWRQLVEYLLEVFDPLHYHGARDYGRLKDVVKSGLFYPAGYGAGRERLRALGDPAEEGVLYAERVQFLTALFGRPVEEVGEVMLDHPLLVELLDARLTRERAIAAAGGITDVFGTHYELLSKSKGGGKERTPRTLLSMEATAIEQYVMLGVFEALRDRPDRILLWQHDGCSLRVRDKRRIERLVWDLAVAVQVRCRDVEERLGIDTILTGLEVKHAPEGSDVERLNDACARAEQRSGGARHLAALAA